VEHVHRMKLSDLKEIVANDETGFTFPLLDPNGEPYGAEGAPITFTVLGTQSKARRKAEDAEARRLLRAGRSQLEPDDIRVRRINLAASCVIAFAGWEDETGAPLAFSSHNVRELLGADERILGQVETAIERHSSFLSKPAATSSSI